MVVRVPLPCYAIGCRRAERLLTASQLDVNVVSVALTTDENPLTTDERGIMAPRTKAAAAPVEEPDEDEFEEMEDGEEDLDELDEIEEPEEEAPKPKAKKTTTAKAAAAAPQYGSAWLAGFVTEQTNEKYDGRAVRMLLRKIAKDGKLEREVGVTRDRYSFTGPNDPTVKAVLAMIKSGEAKAMKQAGLDKVKEQAAAKRAAKKAAEAEEMEDAEEEDEEEEAPVSKPRTRRAAPAKTAPAKATPAKATTARRRASTTS